MTDNSYKRFGLSPVNILLLLLQEEIQTSIVLDI